MIDLSKHVTIFEGPDGSGKTTAARAFAELTGARYVHLGPFDQVTNGLARLYVEAMVPALLGYQDVVLDRCWLSELPYGVIFREGQVRLSVADRRMLERLALRCGAVVVRCLPPWPTVKANYLKRKHLEMLDNDHQLRQVHQAYKKLATDLPVLEYDYTQENVFPVLEAHVHDRRAPAHPVSLASAGHWDADTVLVGEAFGAVKNQDPLYRWPFGSFNGVGCSQWLTELLEGINKSENTLFWVNADQDLRFLVDSPRARARTATRSVYALGELAHEALVHLDVKHIEVPHPQYHKRFHHRETYQLAKELK